MKNTLILLLVFIGGLTYSQNLTLYGNRFVPQSVKSNPASVPTAKFHFGLPLISSIGLSAVNSGFYISDMFETVNGETQLTMTNAIDKMGDNNYIGLAFDMDYLSFGFKVKDKNYFSLSLTERIDFNIDYSRSFMLFLNEGPGADMFIGDSVNIENTGFRANHYRELGINYSRQINDQLSVGVKPKILFGIGNFQNTTTDIAFLTEETDFDLSVLSTISINTSGLSTVLDTTANFDPITYFTNTGNLGFGIDLGGVYKVNDKAELSMSLTDFGIIQWKNDAKRYYNNNATFKFEGVDLNQMLSDSNFTQNFADSLTDIFGLTEAEADYNTFLSTKIYLGGNYRVSKGIMLSVLGRGEIFRNQIYPSFTAASHFRLRNFLYASLSYSALNRSYNNIGGALTMNLGTVQLYASSDNIFGVSRMDYAKNLNVRFGVNVVAGYKDNDYYMSKDDVQKMREEKKLKKMDTDNDGVNDFDDICPELPGLVELNGCPDKDKDGVHDLADECPDQMGFPETNGCPDRDNDGVADKDDQCPDMYGEGSGCPDMDKDGVPNTKDDCPDIPGPLELNGCPDSDGDGIKDSEDNCPEKVGDAEHGGCPDSDGDGIYDNEDKCPDEKGIPKHQGCSDKDTDRDGIPDYKDKCPYRAGLAETGGCP